VDSEREDNGHQNIARERETGAVFYDTAPQLLTHFKISRGEFEGSQHIKMLIFEEMEMLIRLDLIIHIVPHTCKYYMSKKNICICIYVCVCVCVCVCEKANKNCCNSSHQAHKNISM
jgi:hypothetical protein